MPARQPTTAADGEYSNLDGQAVIRVRDGTNLQAQGQSHQHAFWIELHGQDAFVRSETYVENDSSAGAIEQAHADPAITYTRAKPSGD